MHCFRVTYLQLGAIWRTNCFKNLSYPVNRVGQEHFVFAVRQYSSRYDPQKTGRILKQLASRVDQLVNSYERLFEKRAPHAYKLYSTFKSGLRLFFGDTRQYCSLRLQLGTAAMTVESLSHKQLQLLRQYPRDFRRTGLTIGISLLPFTLYFILPVAFKFPRLLLSRHFWTSEQLTEFSALEHTKNLQGREHLLQYLYTKGKTVPNPLRRRSFINTLSAVRSGEVISVFHSTECLPLFSGLPFRLESLSYRHRRLLSRACGWSMSSSGLARDILLLQLSDQALSREGVENLTEAELKACCIERGMFAENLSQAEMLTFLSLWLERSLLTSDNSLSFLAHLPLLTSYQHPENQKLLDKS